MHLVQHLAVTFTNATGDTTGSGAAGNAVLGFADCINYTLTGQGLGYRNVPTVSLTIKSRTDAASTDALLVLHLDEQTGRIASITLDGGEDMKLIRQLTCRWWWNRSNGRYHSIIDGKYNI